MFNIKWGGRPYMDKKFVQQQCCALCPGHQVNLSTCALGLVSSHSSLHNVRYFHNKAKGALHEQKLLKGNKISTDNSLSLKFIWFLKFLMDRNGCTLLYLIPAGFIAPHRFKFQSKLGYLAIYFLNDGRNLVQATSSRSVNWRVLVNTWTKTSLRLVAFLKLPSSNSSELRTSSCQHS